MLKGEIRQQMDFKGRAKATDGIVKGELKQQMDVKGRAKAKKLLTHEK
jgi:hypothetical protein